MRFVNWLNEYFVVRKTYDEPTTSRCDQKPVKFDDASNKAIKRRVSGLLESHSFDELLFAVSKR